MPRHTRPPRSPPRTSGHNRIFCCFALFHIAARHYHKDKEAVRALVLLVFILCLHRVFLSPISKSLSLIIISIICSLLSIVSCGLQPCRYATFPPVRIYSQPYPPQLSPACPLTYRAAKLLLKVSFELDFKRIIAVSHATSIRHQNYLCSDS